MRDRYNNTFLSVLLFSLLVLPGCKPAEPLSDTPEPEIFVVVSELKHRQVMNIDKDGVSDGSITVFESLLKDDKGNVVGRLNGKLISHSLHTEIADLDSVHEDRFRTIIFEFEGEGTIVIDGVSHYPTGKPIMALNDPRDSAITGGTGKYIGARGEVTSTRISENQYEHRFHLIR